MKFIS
jgi:hypothetical protein